MRRTARTRIIRSSDSGGTLFPFLAVLLCTMGSLIVLLVVIGHQSRIRAAQEVAAQSAELHEKVDEELDMSGWRIEQLRASREKTAEQLTQMRLHLSHLEDHVLRLKEKQSALVEEWEKLNNFDAGGESRKAELSRRLDELRGALANAKLRVEDERRRLREAQSAYAIVPYEGPNGTTRRPIYVECRPDAVVLQPLGIEFTAADFVEPLEPGNPLDAALRAVREYWVMHDGFDPNHGEPYPLILVRPHGEMAYNFVREAIQSWGSEFGYELIEEDWDLRFPPAEPGLDRVVARAVDSARQRQRDLVRAAPRRYRQSEPTEFTISPVRGGLVPMGGSRGSLRVAPHNDPPRPGGPPGFGRPGGFGGNSPPEGTAAARGGDGLGAGPQEAYQDLDTALRPNPGRGGSGNGTYTAAGAPSGAASLRGGGARDEGSGGFAGAGARYGESRPQAGSGLATARQSESGGAGGIPGSIAGSPDGSEQGTAALGSSGGSCPAGGSTGDTAVSSLNLGDRGSSNAGVQENAVPSGGTVGVDLNPGTQAATGGQPLRPGEYVPSSGTQGVGDTAAERPSLASTHHRATRSIAESRGINWGLPATSAGAIPITRPIRVECYADRIVLVPEKRNERTREIPLTERTVDGMDSFVSAVWERMDSWGIAGRGMYWRPILHVYTADGAETRAQDLGVLLEGSGLEVRKK